jgi:hypothetical protein
LFACKYILALTLLSGNTFPENRLHQLFWHAYLGDTIKQIAIAHEYMDVREKSYILKYWQDFNSHILLLQSRVKELYNAPRLFECNTLPNRAIVNDLLVDNRRYREDLVNRLALDVVHENEIRQIISEIDILYGIWDAVRDAKCEYYYITVRRKALADLRRMIGDRAYYTGELPPTIPVWRLQY